MSYTGPTYVECCLCGGNATDHRTVKIGDHEAHPACADDTDTYDVVRCPYCRKYEMADDARDWALRSDGLTCPTCAAENAEEAAEEIVAGYAPAGRRNGLIDRLDAIWREVQP